MTYKEYKALVEEYNTIDSISRKNAIEKELLSTLVELTKQLECLYNKYATSFVSHLDWRIGRGEYKIIEVLPEKAVLHYHDRLQYGGECNVDFSIPSKFFDPDEITKKEKELKIDQIRRLRSHIENTDKLINDLNRDKLLMIETIRKLENEL